jgi:hypothetical protein
VSVSLRLWVSAVACFLLRMGRKYDFGLRLLVSPVCSRTTDLLERTQLCVPKGSPAQASRATTGFLRQARLKNNREIPWLAESCSFFPRILERTNPSANTSIASCVEAKLPSSQRVRLPMLTWPFQKRFPGWQAIFILPVFLLCTSLSIFSTTVEKFTLEDLVQKSGRIIVGKCFSTESHWNENNTLILTTSRFLVSEPLKGTRDSFVTVITVGGTLNGITQTVSGMPEFVPEEEVLLFLEPSRNSNWKPLGLSQGKFRILRNRVTGEAEVIHSLSGLQLYDPVTRRLSHSEKPSRAPLNQMVERIKRLVAQ